MDFLLTLLMQKKILYIVYQLAGTQYWKVFAYSS